jgi:TolB protein
MTGRSDLDRELGMYLHERATSQAPDGLLDATLGQIGATGQRPGWLVPDRWFPAQTTFRLAWAMRGSARVALVALLIAIAVAAIVIVGSQRRLPPPFGLARPGLIVAAWGDHLFAMNADGSGRRQLTFGPGSDYRPTWSPDGTSIAYWSYGKDRSTALKVVSPDGRRQVTIDDRLAPSEGGQITWAPDSHRLAFSASAADQPLSLSHIYASQADRPGVTELGGPLLAGFDPAWSPDGKQIAFENLDPVDALWLMDADGSNAHRLTKMPGSGYAFWNAQWSPDGTHLLFLEGDDDAHDVWTIKADGTDERNISNSPEDEGWPSWSPDGSKIAFVRMTPHWYQGNIVVANADGSGSNHLKGPPVCCQMPIWSPDATKLFGFEGANASRKSTIPPIHTMDAIIVYDLLGRTPPTTLGNADDGSWQRLAE